MQPRSIRSSIMTMPIVINQGDGYSSLHKEIAL